MRRMLTLFFGVVLSLALSMVVFAQAKLARSTNSIIINGVVKPSDYSFSQTFDELTVYVNRTAKALDLAVVGDTTGWVGVGLGSLKMDGSTIFIGFVSSSGKVQFKPALGSGHSHQDAGAGVSATIISYAMKQADGKTTLQLALKPAAYIKPGQSALQIIFAVGTERSFIPRHEYRGSLSLALAE